MKNYTEKRDKTMLTEQEKRINVNLHLKGVVGSCGALTKKQRYDLVYGLVDRGYLTAKGQPTAKAIEETRPLQKHRKDWRTID